MDLWHYARNGTEKLGPITSLELTKLFEKGDLDPDTTLVWQKGMTKWISAKEIEFFDKRPAPEPEVIDTDNIDPYLKTLSEHERLPDREPSTHLVPAGYLPAWPYIALMLTGVALVFILAFPHLQVPDAATADEAAIKAANEANAAFLQSKELYSAIWPALVVVLAAQIYQVLIVIRAWKTISQHTPSPRPLVAGLLLLVPIFNVFWRFIAFRAWSQRWNSAVKGDPAAQLPTGLFTAHFVVGVLMLWLVPLGLAFLILDLIVTKKMSSSLAYTMSIQGDSPK